MALFQGDALGCRRGEALIFEAVDFALEPGDALWLSGPNGSGKSSLLRLMSGLLPPVQGNIAWNGAAIDADREAHRARQRYLGHLDAVKTHLTVAENLSFWAGLLGHRAAGRRTRAGAARHRASCGRTGAAIVGGDKDGARRWRGWRSAPRRCGCSTNLRPPWIPTASNGWPV